MSDEHRQLEDYAADAVRVLWEARSVLGRSEAVNAWLNSPQPALGNQVPAAMLFTAEGTTLVMEELQRIQRFRQTAKQISRRLQQLDSNRHSTSLKALSALEVFDPELVKLAADTFNSRDKVAAWLAGCTGKRDIRTPWDSIADGDLDSPRRMLKAVAEGDYL